MASPHPVRRCAIYTRKSSDEGLDQAYNSLAAQRDACAAYVASQKHEGWICLAKSYDDGGFSGGSLQRPALQELLRDMLAGRIDIIVVYKIDRLTRSLADFAKLTETLDAHQVSFVAVTQQFNTSTSMGRLTLNVLLSFAQFEREVAGERIRDKIAASKKRGMWMGGHPPLGYDVKERKLVINPAEAETVRHIFCRYLVLKSVRALQEELAQCGIMSKVTIRENGRCQGGNTFSRGALATILKNPIYRGFIAHKGSTYAGDHEAIVDETLFSDVQAALADSGPGDAARAKLASPALLKGLLVDATGDRLLPTHCRKGPTRYRYYTSKKLLKDGRSTAGNGLRLPAADTEALVITSLATHLRNKLWIASLTTDKSTLQAMLDSADKLAAKVEQQRQKNAGLLADLIKQVAVDSSTLRLVINRQALLEQLGQRPLAKNPKADGETPASDHLPLEITIRSHLLRRGKQMRLVVGNQTTAASADHTLIHDILRARRWYAALSSGSAPTIATLAKSEGCSASYVSLKISLAFLAPDILEAILNGTQPSSLTPERLKKACPLPINWDEQRALLLT